MWAIRLEDRKGKEHDEQKENKKISADSIKGKEDQEKHTMKVFGKLKVYLKKKNKTKHRQKYRERDYREIYRERDEAQKILKMKEVQKREEAWKSEKRKEV